MQAQKPPTAPMGWLGDLLLYFALLRLLADWTQSQASALPAVTKTAGQHWPSTRRAYRHANAPASGPMRPAMRHLPVAPAQRHEAASSSGRRSFHLISSSIRARVTTASARAPLAQNAWEGVAPKPHTPTSASCGKRSHPTRLVADRPVTFGARVSQGARRSSLGDPCHRLLRQESRASRSSDARRHRAARCCGGSRSLAHH